MSIQIETQRLLLREMTDDDAPGMFALDSDPKVLTYLNSQPHTDIAQSLAVIHFVQQQYRDNGIGRWAVLLKDTNTFIGWAGLKLNKTPLNGHVNYLDLGYRFIPEYWGKGYATEASRVSLSYGFKILKAPVIYAAVMLGNEASQNVLEKVGFRPVNEFVWDGNTHRWFECDNRNEG